MNDTNTLLVIYTYNVVCPGMVFVKILEGTLVKKLSTRFKHFSQQILTRKKCWAQMYMKQTFGSTRMHERHYALTTPATNDFINLSKNIFESLFCQSPC